jgi:hypothetical protein
MRKSLILMTLPIAACSTTPPVQPIPAPPQVEAALAPEMTPAAAALAYPQTRRDELVDNQFGVAVADPYRWLENDVRKDPQVATWVAEQNKVTDAFLDTLPGRDILKKRMTELYNYERVGTPVKKGSRYFYQRNAGLQNQSPLYVRESLNGPERLLIDPNTFSADGATALAEWVPSEDGRYLLYAIQDGGIRLAYAESARRRHRQGRQRRDQVGEVLRPFLVQGQQGLLLFALPRGRRGSGLPVAEQEPGGLLPPARHRAERRPADVRPARPARIEQWRGRQR